MVNLMSSHMYHEAPFDGIHFGCVLVSSDVLLRERRVGCDQEVSIC